MNNDRDTFVELRGKFDGSDPFMNRGHQIIKLRQSNRDIPAWAKSNKRLQEILLRAFPLLRTNPKQRLAAARWAVIIQLFFRVRMTRSQVAAQTGLSSNIVKLLVRNIRRTANGLRGDTGKPLGKKKGRPKKG